MGSERNMRMESYSPQNLSKIWNKFNQNLLARRNNATQSQNISATQKQDCNQQRLHNTNIKNSLK